MMKAPECGRRVAAVGPHVAIGRRPVLALAAAAATVAVVGAAAAEPPPRGRGFSPLEHASPPVRPLDGARGYRPLGDRPRDPLPRPPEPVGDVDGAPAPRGVATSPPPAAPAGVASVSSPAPADEPGSRDPLAGDGGVLPLPDDASRDRSAAPISDSAGNWIVAVVGVGGVLLLILVFLRAGGGRRLEERIGRFAPVRSQGDTRVTLLGLTVKTTCEDAFSPGREAKWKDHSEIEVIWLIERTSDGIRRDFVSGPLRIIARPGSGELVRKEAHATSCQYEPVPADGKVKGVSGPVSSTAAAATIRRDKQTIKPIQGSQLDLILEVGFGRRRDLRFDRVPFRGAELRATRWRDGRRLEPAGAATGENGGGGAGPATGAAAGEKVAPSR